LEKFTLMKEGSEKHEFFKANEKAISQAMKSKKE
jgi:hypothetical protein